MEIKATKKETVIVVPAVTKEVAAEVTLTLSAADAVHLAHRLNVSSYQTFDNYRKANKLADFHRHPFADKMIAGLKEAGVEI